MFVLLDKKTGGVYAVRDDNHTERVVQIFLDKDDAVRYYQMLRADNYPRKLSVPVSYTHLTLPTSDLV